MQPITGLHPVRTRVSLPTKKNQPVLVKHHPHPTQQPTRIPNQARLHLVIQEVNRRSKCQPTITTRLVPGFIFNRNLVLSNAEDNKFLKQFFKSGRICSE
jgi:hypothetical protein